VVSSAGGSDKVTVFLVGLLFLGAVLMGWQEVMEGKLLPVGSPAPAFSARAVDGGTVTLASLAGRVVLVDFWATWCPPCVEEMPYLISTVKAYEAQGVTLVAVSNDDLDEQAAAVAQFLERMPQLSPYAVYGTPPLGASYLVRSLPTLYVIDRHGQVSAARAGQPSEAELRGWIEAALAR
jgi:thiol-disulfide isomerase/thioredoxin